MYKTTDLRLAVSLFTSGYKFDINHLYGQSFEFVFKDDSQIVEKAVNEYWNDEMKVNPRTYAENFNATIQRIKEAKIN